ncbi:hypothetical protein GALMADRAFT_1118642 [Galerina marginata CBS 339.88]|uniref:Uncharacterized protein n=1 Tax=Galerina marginata (strain CBS 339.88) TaxID=685588 RepID=A0A067TPW2_GALM3|nr:hypothetical protein GALMADRAFT_1118642 [Galerina marginata CBS 339.88]
MSSFSCHLVYSTISGIISSGSDHSLQWRMERRNKFSSPPVFMTNRAATSFLLPLDVSSIDVYVDISIDSSFLQLALGQTTRPRRSSVDVTTTTARIRHHPSPELHISPSGSFSPFISTLRLGTRGKLYDTSWPPIQPTSGTMAGFLHVFLNAQEATSRNAHIYVFVDLGSASDTEP